MLCKKRRKVTKNMLYNTDFLRQISSFAIFRPFSATIRTFSLPFTAKYATFKHKIFYFSK